MARQPRKGTSVFTSLVLVTTMLLAQGATPAPERILIDHHKAIRLRDGVTVYADVYRPAREGRFPTSSCGRRTACSARATGVHDRLISLARMGYAVVNTDVRGRYESEGAWDPFRAEGKDGYDVVEWAAKQPWSNGKVGDAGRQLPRARAVGHARSSSRRAWSPRSRRWPPPTSTRTGSRTAARSGSRSTSAGASCGCRSASCSRSGTSPGPTPHPNCATSAC